jgi:hypothetical protein
MLSDKKLEKLEKVLTATLMEEMEASSKESLRTTIVNAATAIKVVQEELDANEKYQECKENLKAMSQGLRDVKKFHNAKVAFALHLLEDEGKL